MLSQMIIIIQCGVPPKPSKLPTLKLLQCPCGMPQDLNIYVHCLYIQYSKILCRMICCMTIFMLNVHILNLNTVDIMPKLQISFYCYIVVSNFKAISYCEIINLPL